MLIIKIHSVNHAATLSNANGVEEVERSMASSTYHLKALILKYNAKNVSL